MKRNETNRNIIFLRVNDIKLEINLAVLHHQYISPYESDPSSEKLVCPLCNKSDPAALITDLKQMK
jgi:hypothetical protein